MKRTMIVMIALTMLLAWTGSAMAQVAADSALHAAARQNCMSGNDRWANAELGMVFPYFPASAGSDWWGGIGIISSGAVLTANNIDSGELCLVAINKDGLATAQVFDQVIYAGNMRTVVVENIGTNAIWGQEIVVAVFANEGLANRAGVVNQLRGFGMIGNGMEGQGYFTAPEGQVGAPTNASTLVFNYIPDTGWWKGMTLFNNHRTDVSHVRIDVRYEDGLATHNQTGTNQRYILRPGTMMDQTIEDWVPGFDTTKRARITVRSQAAVSAANAAGGPNLMGFSMFGDGKQAMGYLGTAQ